jgi:hypothetical protein
MSASDELWIHFLGTARPAVALPREGSVVLGSSSTRAGIQVPGQGVADLHCAIGRTKDGGWAIKDLGSEFGTRVNGKPVAQARIKSGDQLLLGSVSLRLEAPAASEPPPASTPPQPERKATSKKGGYPDVKGYRVVDRLGRGAMGEVFLAVQESLDREVALKVLSKKLEADANFVRSFQAEARAAAALNHPNVVTVHDVGESGGVHYLTMEYMDRGSLEDRVAKQGPLHWRAALDALYDAASGLVYAESRGIVHRDIKPDNLMQNHTGATKIADLGLATSENDAASHGEGKIFGTPHFISPEQVRGEKADCRSDLYSLGATAFRLLTGHTPFEGDSTREIVRAKLTEDPTPLSEYVDDLPEGMTRIVERLLQRDPKDRYPSASALLKELEALKAGREAAAVGAPPQQGGLPRWAVPVGIGVLVLASLPFLFGGDPAPRDVPGPSVTPSEDASPKPVVEEGPSEVDPIPVEVDDDTQEKLFEIEAENELLKLGQRDLDKPTRRERLLELATRFLGTTAATKATEEAARLESEILMEQRAELERDNLLGAALAELRKAAALDARPVYPGRSLRAMTAVPGQEALLGDSAFQTARKALEDEVVASALAELGADRDWVRTELEAGRFEAAREKLVEMLGRTDLPEFPEGSAPARVDEVLLMRGELRARLDGLPGLEKEFLAARVVGDREAIAKSLSGSDGLRSDLRRLDLTAAAQRVSALAAVLTTEPQRAWAAALAEDLEQASRAFPILETSWQEWRRKSVPDPRDPRGATREAIGVTASGLRLNVKGAVEDVPWGDYGGQTVLLSTLFRERLGRDYDTQEARAIASLMRYAALSELAESASEMFQIGSQAVFTEGERAELVEVLDAAAEWETDPVRAQQLTREREAARQLGEALRAASDGDWTTAVSALEHLLDAYADTLLVRLASDGSLAGGPR